MTLDEKLKWIAINSTYGITPTAMSRERQKLYQALQCPPDIVGTFKEATEEQWKQGMEFSSFIEEIERELLRQCAAAIELDRVLAKCWKMQHGKERT